MGDCFLCKTSCTDKPVCIGWKGKQGLISASKQRQDGLHDWIESCDNILVHSECRKAYTNPKSIIILKKRKAECEPQIETPKLRPKTTGSAKNSISEACLFCYEDLKDFQKLPHKRQKNSAFSNVETIEFKGHVLKKAAERGDVWGQAVTERLQNHIDLVAAEAKYHRKCAQDFFSLKNMSQTLPGKPIDTRRLSAFNDLCCYIDENNECQYTIPFLMEQMKTYLNGEDGYSVNYFKQKLQERYQDNITITNCQRKTNVVTFRDSAQNILQQRLMESLAHDNENKNDMIIEMAAAIIRNDIRTCVYDLSEYPSPHDDEKYEEMIPGSLKLLLHKVMDPKSKDNLVNSRRCTAISHAIISSCRPRSFISPVLLSIAVYIHRNFASRQLIEILNKLGFSEQYKEVLRFENSAINSGEPSYGLSGFTQFVFDNADFNVATLRGHDTFHAMGGIACVTPAGNSEKFRIKRIVDIPHADIIGKYGRVPIKTFSKPLVPALRSVTVEALQEIPPQENPISSLDLFWMLGYVSNISPCLPWNGFMKNSLPKNEYETSRIEILPFINLQPSNPSTIYSALSFAQTQCEQNELRVCTVTFDQPLYQKASEIVAASDDLNRIVVRLGGFHLLMSYLGSIGHIMSGSGLEDLWKRVYARDSVPHMLTGHAFSRAVRAHTLTLLSLVKTLLSNAGWELPNDDPLVKLYSSVVKGEKEITAIEENQSFAVFQQFLSDQVETASTTSKTGKLWIQYIKQVLLMLDFIRAERTGDWNLHIHSVRRMIPHFHAAGHLPYAKSARLYLQQMSVVSQIMPPEEFTLFTEKGFFAIRRTNEFWSGNFSDQTIEQVLMRSLKTSGGMTQGRGITDSTLTKWVHGLPHCLRFCGALEQFSGVVTAKSEQHRDLRSSTQLSDKKDYDIFVDWLKSHPPFAGYQPDRLVSISTGVIADQSVNCDDAVQLGAAAASKLTGKPFSEISLHRNDKVKTFVHKSNVTVKGQKTSMNSSLLFNRITCVLKDKSEMEGFLCFELASPPPSIFSDGVMRKNTKSTLGVLLKSFVSSSNTTPNNCQFVVDGGNLLHSVVWRNPSTYDELCQSYTNYVLKHYGVGTIVIFDGYEYVSTKTSEQLRRSNITTSSDIMFDSNMQTTTTQGAFLTNSHNKKLFIKLLSGYLTREGIKTHQARADADALIISTALNSASDFHPVAVVGKDTDLLVMLVALATEDLDLHMMCSVNPKEVYNINDIRAKVGHVSNYLMPLHAITGCDTVSALYNQGKRKAFNLMHSSNDHTSLKVFIDAESTHQQIHQAGEDFLLKLYGGSHCKSLDELRYKAYNKTISKTSLSSNFQLAALPPTSSAAKLHCYRAYFTVQEWLGKRLDPLAWGWKMEGTLLTPVENERPVAPDRLLNLISCSCKPNGCTATCGCKKLGVYCSSLCSKCEGETCNNVAPMSTLLVHGEQDELE